MNASGTPYVQTGELGRTDSLAYDIIRLLGSPFSYEVMGIENIQTPGPAIYIANHLGPIGPLEASLSVPVRFYPWAIAEMLDFERAPLYLFNDFIHPVLHLNGKFGMFFSTLLSKISVRLLRSIGAVPIDRFGGATTDGFRQSLKLLHEGKNLLIFPEDSMLPLDPQTSMRHFMPGFATLCSLFQSETGYLLPVYPMAVHDGSETVAIGKAEYFHAQGRHHQAIEAFSQQLESRVRELYLELKRSAETIE